MDWPMLRSDAKESEQSSSAYVPLCCLGPAMAAPQCREFAQIHLLRRSAREGGLHPGSPILAQCAATTDSLQGTPFRDCRVPKIRMGDFPDAALPGQLHHVRITQMEVRL